MNGARPKSVIRLKFSKKLLKNNEVLPNNKIINV